jgi:uroporphyrinogen-III synthase
MASPRAPATFARQCRERGADALLGLPLAVVGDGTATACIEAGLRPVVVGPGTGGGLAAVLAERWTAPTTAIVACGQHRRPELTDALIAAGHRLLPVTVYRMSATPIEELPSIGSGVAAVVVTSPRAAALYLEAAGGQPLPCPHWALGPTTRDAVRSLDLDCRIPPRPTLESLAEELCKT